MASCSYSNVTTNSVGVTISGLQYNAIAYDRFGCTKNLYSYDGVAGWTSSNNYNSTTHTITGLSPNTRYQLGVNAKYNGTWTNVGLVDFTTDPEPLYPPTFSSYIRGNKSIYVAFNNSYSNANRFFIQVYKNGVFSSNVSGLTSPSYNFTNLTAGSLYKFRCYAYDSNGVYDDSPYSSFTIEILPGFNWDAVFYSESDEFDISVTEWNNFLNCIRDTYDWIGATLPRTLTNISTGHELTAAEFNDVRFCIGSQNSTNIDDKTAYSGSGEPIDSNLLKALDFNTLTTKLNGIEI